MLEFPLRVTLCGFGGQGIILTAVILGTTAVTKNNLYAVQTQSYGSEARGGQCQAELVIDKEKIGSPVAERKNLLVAMFQDAYEKYIDILEEDGVLVLDPDLVSKQVREVKHTFAVPATQIAVDLGNRMAAMMVMLGFLGECLGILKEEDMIDVVKHNVSPRFVELNIKAVQAGVDYAKTHQLYYR